MRFLMASGMVVVFVSLVSASSSMVSLEVGANPGAIAVNPQTGEIAVVNSGSDDVSIVDRDTLHVSTVHAGLLPAAIAVNQLTGYAYVANSWGNSVTAIYGYGEGMLVRSSSSAPAVTGIDTAASVATIGATSRTSRTLNPLD